MPNHCTNEVSILFPSKAEADEFIALIVRPDLGVEDDKVAEDEPEGTFTLPRGLCNAFHPMPEILQDTPAHDLGPSFDHNGRRLEWVNDPDNEHWTPESYEEARLEWHAQKEKQDAAVAATGFKDWYDWACDDANWGTKWGDYDTQYSQWDGPKTSTVDISYTSAWGPLSTSFWKRVSDRFPEAQIVVYFSEPGMAFQGSESYYGGECVFEESGELRDYAMAAEIAVEQHIEALQQ